MARAITSPELSLLRSEGQWSKLYMAVLVPNTIYTARLASLPSSNDQVYEISYNTGSGTLGNVKAGMLLYVGTSAGSYNLGMCRIRVAPDGTKIYIGETSEINWQSNCYLTIVDDFDLHPRHIHVDEDGGLLMDVNVAYSNQHESFDPVPVLGSHAVLWLTGATVSADFDASDSWVFDSTISAYAWTAPGSSASSGMSTATPTITYNAAGNYRVYCTVTAANGKTTMGVRNVFVFDDDNPPATVFQLANCEGSVDSGGWMFDVTMQAEATLSEIRERTLVVLFARDYYENTEQSIGPIDGRENVIAVGRVAGESIRWDPIAGQVHFTVYGPHYWLNRIKVSACQLNFTNGSPAAWDQVKNLDVDRGLWHLLHWRSTATTVTDFYRTSDTRYADKLATLANFMWAQLVEFAGLNLMAHVLCDRYGRLFAEIDPQMVPAGSRTWPVVMTVTTDDWMDVSDFERVTVHETGQVNITTRLVNSSGVSSTLYSLSPGHIPRKHGEWELNDGLLAASQAGSNQMAGLLLGWKNNEFPDIPLKLAGNNHMIDICPRQFLDITIVAADTPRGIGYDGNLIPRRVVLRYDNDSRWLSVEVNSEAETFEQISANGDIPGSGDVDLSIPPLPDLPELPDIPIIIPGTGEGPSDDGPVRVLLWSSLYGIIYTDNFNAAGPNWSLLNAGLGTTPTGASLPHYKLIDRVLVCSNGAVYAGRFRRRSGQYWSGSDNASYFFLARAPSIGGTFTILHDYNTFAAEGTPGFFEDWGILTMAKQPLVAESVGFVLRKNQPGLTNRFYIGAAGSYAEGISGLNEVGGGGQPSIGLSYGFGKWMYTTYGKYQLIAANGMSITGGATVSGLDLLPFNPESNALFHAGASGRTYIPGDGFGSPTRNLLVGDNNMASSVWISDNKITFIGFHCDPTGSYIMTRYDTGAKGKSSDGGSSWALLPSLPPGSWYFRYAGSPSRWIAAGGSSVRYTPDFGTTWQNKEGNLLSVAPTGGIVGVRVLEY